MMKNETDLKQKLAAWYHKEERRIWKELGPKVTASKRDAVINNIIAHNAAKDAAMEALWRSALSRSDESIKRLRLRFFGDSSQGRRSRNDERDELSQRCDGRAMANHQQIVAAEEEARKAARGPSGNHQRYFLRQSHGLPVASLAARLSKMEDGLHGILAMAEGGSVAADQRRPAGASASRRREETYAYGGDHRQPIGEDHRSRGEERGYDAGKKITGRKRHLAVDTLGMVLAVVVHGAYWQDQTGAVIVLWRLRDKFRRLKVIFADSAYGRDGLVEIVKETFGWILQTVLRPVRAEGFVVLPKRWIVERTFAWLSRYRRHSKDYERNTETSEAMVLITMVSSGICVRSQQWNGIQAGRRLRTILCGTTSTITNGLARSTRT